MLPKCFKTVVLHVKVKIYSPIMEKCTPAIRVSSRPLTSFLRDRMMRDSRKSTGHSTWAGRKKKRQCSDRFLNWSEIAQSEIAQSERPFQHDEGRDTGLSDPSWIGGEWLKRGWAFHADTPAHVIVSPGLKKVQNTFVEDIQQRRSSGGSTPKTKENTGSGSNNWLHKRLHRPNHEPLLPYWFPCKPAVLIGQAQDSSHLLSWCFHTVKHDQIEPDHRGNMCRYLK